MKISTHVLDAVCGKPGAGIKVILEMNDGDWLVIGTEDTNADGRIDSFIPDEALVPGIYRLRFQTGAYFASRKLETCFPEIVVTFEVKAGAYHMPLNLSPFSYTTYRGS